MLDAPHVAPLTAYAAELRRQEKGEVPDFDPLDGGIDALALFLHEKPGPMTAGSRGGKRAGSGFISRDNDDATAEAIFAFMQAAGIPRTLTVIWNVVPWWNGTRAVTSEELCAGGGCVGDLIRLLPKLRAIVFVGSKANRARSFFPDSKLALFSSDHPSPLVRAAHRQRWEAIPTEWAKVRPAIGLG